jgi:hypothetical protein
MSVKQNTGSADRIERIIRFFKSLKVKKPECDVPDDAGRDKTEAEYQREQVRWLETIEKRKQSG